MEKMNKGIIQFFDGEEGLVFHHNKKYENTKWNEVQ